MSSRTFYTADFKKNVIRYAEETSNLAIQWRFGIDKSNVRRWRRQREQLFLYASKHKTFGGPKQGRHHELEVVLNDFVRAQRNGFLPVNAEIISTKARELSRVFNINKLDFKVSRHWVQLFMKRWGYSLRRHTSIAQKLPANYEEQLTAF